MSRPLSNEEKNTLTSTLALMETGEEVGYMDPIGPADPTPYLSQIDSLVVSSECGCGQLGCRSVFFTEEYKGKSMFEGVAPVAHGERDNAMVIIYAHNETGELVEMEII